MKKPGDKPYTFRNGNGEIVKESLTVNEYSYGSALAAHDAAWEINSNLHLEPGPRVGKGLTKAKMEWLRVAKHLESAAKRARALANGASRRPLR